MPRGRKSKYETHVKPRLKEIEEWLKEGATEEEVAKALGVAVSSLNLYKNQYMELSTAFAHARKAVIIRIKEALLKKALGFSYEEEKRVGKKDKNGENIVLVEKYTRYCPPSETAAAMLLRNYDEEWRDMDSATTRLKQQAQDLKKAIAEATNFEAVLNIEENNE